jgi:transcriptional regulator with XRE-family HTH domain
LLRNLGDHCLMAETIGQRIKRERLKLGWTQRQLADAAEVGVPHISKVEAGRENPSDELILRLAGIFGVDAEELLLVAHRLPESVVEQLAANPAEGLAFLRSWPGPKGRRS